MVFDDTDLDWITDTIPLQPVGGGVWSVTTPLLRPGTRYAIRVDGPHAPGNTFNRGTLLVEPYSKGLVSGGYEDWRSVVVDGGFDWGGVAQARACRWIARSSTRAISRACRSGIRACRPRCTARTRVSRTPR